MDSLADMIVLDNTLVDLGELDLNIVKEVIDAHVSETGRPMPQWSSTGDVIIVISDEEEGTVAEGGAAPSIEEGVSGQAGVETVSPQVKEDGEGTRLGAIIGGVLPKCRKRNGRTSIG